MNLFVFNASLLVGWLLLSAGATLLNPAIGLIVSGAALIVLTLVGSLIAGGVYKPAADEAAG